jgi:hypothetical protein
MPLASGLTAVIAVFSAAMPALAADGAAAANAARAQEWWLGSLNVPAAWQSAKGAGVTVAVLGTGVAAGHPDLAGRVITGPDYSASGRKPGGPFWGIDGTAVASVIAGHGHGAGGASGMMGVAPAAKILSIRVTLEFNDPLNSDRAVTRRLPGAIAAGITYAVDHGARVIDLPLDPATYGLTGQGDPAVAGGSPAEQAAVAYALRKSVVLVAPAGDDGQGRDIVNYPAAYTGVIAVGAIARDGHLAPFSSRRSYVSLTAPGANLLAATPPAGYAPISSTSTASGIVAGLAALILSRFPHLTAAQVTQALTRSTQATASATTAASAPATSRGTGYGTVNAARAVAVAASLSAATAPAPSPARSSSPAPSASSARARTSASVGPQAAGALAGSLVRDVVAVLCGLILLLVALLLLNSRRKRRAAADPGQPGRARPAGAHGAHGHRKPDRDSGADRETTGSRVTIRPQPARPATRAAAKPSTKGAAKPGVPAARPGALTARPGAFTAQPGAFTAQPGAFTAEPGAFTAQPGAFTAQPGAFTAEPGAFAAEPYPPAARPGTPAARPGAPAAGGWPAFGGWQGGSLGEIDHAADPPPGPAMMPAPKAATSRSGRASRSAAARASGDEGGPPWAAAPEPGRTIGPLPMTPGGLFAPDPGPGIRVPGDMTGLLATSEYTPPSFGPESQPPGFGPESTPPGFGFIASPPAPDLISPPTATIGGFTQQSVDFAAAPVPLDYAPPAGPTDFGPPAGPTDFASPAGPAHFAAPAGPAGSGPTAGFSSLWDLAATDVFPAVSEPDPTEPDAGEGE